MRSKISPIDVTEEEVLTPQRGKLVEKFSLFEDFATQAFNRKNSGMYGINTKWDNG